MIALMTPEHIIMAALLGCMSLSVAVIDIRTRRIPNLLSALILITGLCAAWRFSSAPFTDHLIGAAVGYGVFAIIGEVFFRMKGREGLGLGDAKLFGATGAWLGWAALPMAALEASLLGIALIILLRLSGKPSVTIPFGPALAVVLWATWVFGSPAVEMTWR